MSDLQQMAITPNRVLLINEDLSHRYRMGAARCVQERPDWSLIQVQGRWYMGAGGDMLSPQWASAAVINVQNEDIDILRGSGIPIVNLIQTNVGTPFPTVCADNVAVGRLAFEHLRSLGLARFAFLPGSGSDSLSDGPLRQQGFLAAARDAGFADRTCVIPNVVTSVNLRSSLYQQGQVFLNYPRPFGLMCFGDWLAAHALSALHSAHLSVPDEVAVIGVDDDEIVCSTTRPTLSSVDTNQQRVGYEAAKLAMSMAEDAPPPPGPILVPPVGVIERRSTQVMACDDPDVADAMRLINRHQDVERPITVGQLCKALLIPRRTIDSKFVRELGHTVADELRRRRLRKTLTLLAQTNLSMVEVADRAGFQSVSQMTAAVRKHTGRPCIAYRKWLHP